ncbi:hypothetical protein L6452_26284 [Arctium lappa]|uniref:Uncharacterized protein n=1 Tax=Arctium lappa TaxID=4217 RepID=A0ACB9ABZ4_ARCLA|nr:hypothetical protein L6452_26284 [Arctium lappa]
MLNKSTNQIGIIVSSSFSSRFVEQYTYCVMYANSLIFDFDFLSLFLHLTIRLFPRSSNPFSSSSAIFIPIDSP